jgi:hypothetical protein
LPVYRDIKRGGTLELTVIRKISGDLNALRDDVQNLLRLPDHKVILNTLTKQVKIKVRISLSGAVICIVRSNISLGVLQAAGGAVPPV